MLTPEQAAQCVEAGIPVLPDVIKAPGVILPVVQGRNFLRIVKFKADNETGELYLFLYTEHQMSVEDATEKAIDWLDGLSHAHVKPENLQPLLVI